MSKSGSIVAPLGNYITLVTRKNKNLEVTKLVGVTVEKEIITSIASGRNTNLQICLIVEFGDFVVRLMNIEMTGRLAIGLYEKADKAIVSSQYHVFKITNPLLNKHYLMMIFQKEVTELQLLYRCFGGIRGELAWKDFVKFPIKFPSLDKQERIVKKYQTVTKYIELKRRINELFEKQMTAYFHVLFDNLTNYKIKNFGEFLTTIRCGRPPRGNLEQERKYFCKAGGIPWLQVGDISKRKYKFVSETADQLTPEGFKRGKCKIVPKESVIVVGAGVNEKALGLCMISFCDFVLNTTLWGVVANNLIGGGHSCAHNLHLFFY